MQACLPSIACLHCTEPLDPRPALQVTPLPRQRPVVVAARFGPLGCAPLLLPTLGTPPGSSASALAAAGEAPAPAPSGLGARKAAAPGRSRFAAAVAAERENEEEPASPASRSSSVASLAKGASGSSLPLCARASSFTSFGGGSSGNLQLAERAHSFTSFAGSSGNLRSPSGGLGSRPASFSKLGAAEGGEAAGGSPRRPLAERLSRLRLL